MGVQIQGDTGNVIATKGTYSGNVTIGGTLTYEDVTNIDSVGLVTARTGIEIGARPGVAASISVDGNMIVSGISTFGGDVQVPDKIIHSGDTNTAIRFPDNDTVSVETGGSEAARFDSSGRLLVGHNSSLAIGGGDNSPLQTSATSSVVFGGVRYTNASGGPFLSLSKSRAAAAGSNTIVQDGDELGTILFAGDDGTDLISKGAQITAAVDGTPGSNDMPGRLQFYTTADGAASPTERLRITKDGAIGIAGANYGTSGQVLSSQGSGSAVQWATVATDIQFASWRVTTNWSGNVDPIDNFVEKNHNVTMGYSSGIFSFPSTGFWEIMMQTYLYSNANQPNIELHLMTTTNNSSYNTRSQSYSSLHNYSSANLYTAIQVNHIFDVTDTSQCKVKFKTAGNSANFHTSSSSDESYAIFKRLADT